MRSVVTSADLPYPLYAVMSTSRRMITPPTRLWSTQGEATLPRLWVWISMTLNCIELHQRAGFGSRGQVQVVVLPWTIGDYC